ncbi:MAG: hypothetical protein FJ255_08715 [Phycisphaerae bacterium]|nr:hypothetical protein [Phycisphaerae bacterium]
MVLSKRLHELISAGKVHRLGAGEVGAGGRLRAIFEDRPEACPTVPLGIPAIDAVLPGGGLPLGAVHEWFGFGEGSADEPVLRRGGWITPVSLLTHLARRACGVVSARRGEALAVAFIGRRSWPTPWAMAAGARTGFPAIVDRSLLIDPADVDQRVWAIDVALRSRAIGAVVADGSGLDLSATRRLQLAAEAGGTPALVVRPPWEVPVLSSSWSRWLVGPASTGWSRPRWRVTLARCRGAAVAPDAAPSWLVEIARPWSSEHRREESLLDLAADLVDRPGAASAVALSA